jgi:hypothetical protein
MEYVSQGTTLQPYARADNLLPFDERLLVLTVACG